MADLLGGGRGIVHLCVDMQRLFAEDTDWHTPWMGRVLPNVERLAGAHPERTIFTRFIPARRVGEGRGAWAEYYERWSSMTVEALGEDMVELVEPLRRFVPPATVIDKHAYSPWLDDRLDRRLAELEAERLLVTGGETDVCVLATVLGAIDRGFRVSVATDALCSSCDETHDAMLLLYRNRFGQQVETLSTEDALRAWR